MINFLWYNPKKYTSISNKTGEYFTRGNPETFILFPYAADAPRCCGHCIRRRRESRRSFARHQHVRAPASENRGDRSSPAGCLETLLPSRCDERTDGDPEAKNACKQTACAAASSAGKRAATSAHRYGRPAQTQTHLPPRYAQRQPEKAASPSPSDFPITCSKNATGTSACRLPPSPTPSRCDGCTGYAGSGS